MEPANEIPPDFPYWNHVTQRRYDGPTVIYLGNGYALTARHVGMGEIFLDGEIFEPERGSKRTILNKNGTPADAMIFSLEDERLFPDWPVVPIATEPPRDGEDVVLIGFGRERARVDELEDDHGPLFSFRWTDRGAKRWATNRSRTVRRPRPGRRRAARSSSASTSPTHGTRRATRPRPPSETRGEASSSSGTASGSCSV